MRSRSKLSLSERRERASQLYTKGFTVADVARRLNVEWDTAKSYKEWHETRLTEQADANPQLLQDVLRNTIASIAELDEVRKEAWRTYHQSESKQVRLQALNTVRSCQTDKAKLFGLFGVKQDFYVMVTNVRVVQDKILDFMARELCDSDRRKFEAFLLAPELQKYMGEVQGIPIYELGMGDDDDIVEAEVVG